MSLDYALDLIEGTGDIKHIRASISALILSRCLRLVRLLEFVDQVLNDVVEESGGLDWMCLRDPYSRKSR